MRTWLAVVGLGGLLLMPLLDMADGGPSKIRTVDDRPTCETGGTLVLTNTPQ